MPTADRYNSYTDLMYLLPNQHEQHGYLPFGHGSRGCIGNTLAMSEGAAMVVSLLRRYTFEPVPGFKPQIIGGISLVPKNGVRVRFTRDV